jgi:hypothetical protein
MGREKHEQEQSHQIHIVTHLHDVIATCKQEFVHKGRKKPEETVRMDKSSQLENVELEVLTFVTHEARED